MTTKPKKPVSPHAPKPTGADASKKQYRVVDAKGTEFYSGLTWDEAWKRKEELAGLRKTTTPRIQKMDATAPSEPKKTTRPFPLSAKGADVVSWSDEQRKAKALEAARNATPPGVQMSGEFAVPVGPQLPPTGLTEENVDDAPISPEEEAVANALLADLGLDADPEALAAVAADWETRPHKDVPGKEGGIDRANAAEQTADSLGDVSDDELADLMGDGDGDTEDAPASER